jgi:hypothetical protein
MVLRKQYARRDPQADPLAPLIVDHTSPELSLSAALDGEPITVHDLPFEGASHPIPASKEVNDVDTIENAPSPSAEALTASVDATTETNGGSVPPPSDSEPSMETRHHDWLQLPMLTKLESMYTLTEWQFMNPNRLRQQMKSDDEDASWVLLCYLSGAIPLLNPSSYSQRIEPLGYDAKKNAYWLIAGKLTIRFAARCILSIK